MTYTKDQQAIIHRFFDHYPGENREYAGEELQVCIEGMKQATSDLLKEAIAYKSLSLIEQARVMDREIMAIMQQIMQSNMARMQNSGLVAPGNGVPKSLDVTAGWKK